MRNFVIQFLKFSIFIISSLATSVSLANLHLEPYAGLAVTYTNARILDQEILNTNKATYEYFKSSRYYYGPIFGLRLGYSSLGLAVGLDASAGRWKSVYEENFKLSQNAEILTPILAGLFISYKLPLLFRAYAGLFPLAKVNIERKQNELVVCDKSLATKLGVSYLSLPFISVNFEYLFINMQKNPHCPAGSHSGTVYANFLF